MKVGVDGKYKTRKGSPVQIYKVFGDNGSNLCLVHGAILSNGSWVLCSWTLEGKYNPTSSVVSDYDLVEVGSLYEDIKIDDVVVVWDKLKQSVVGHFAGTDEIGNPTIWVGGRTSYTGKSKVSYLNCIKYKSFI